MSAWTPITKAYVPTLAFMTCYAGLSFLDSDWATCAALTRSLILQRMYYGPRGSYPLQRALMAFDNRLYHTLQNAGRTGGLFQKRVWCLHCLRALCASVVKTGLPTGHSKRLRGCSWADSPLLRCFQFVFQRGEALDDFVHAQTHVADDFDLLAHRR